MPTEVIMPKVDMDMTHGTLAVWHVPEGEAVAEGDPLFDIETEKAAMEVEAQSSGRLHHVTARPGDRVEVGATIAWLYGAGETVGPPPQATAPPAAADPSSPEPLAPAMTAPDHEARQASAAQSVPMPAASGPQPEPSHVPVRATPAARAAARTGGMALREVPGSGPRGRVQSADILKLVEARAPSQQELSHPATWKPEGGSLHTTLRPGIGTPILLLHGFTADSQSWAPLERAIGPKPPIMRIDMPGHGKSPKREVAGFAELAKMVVEAFDETTRALGKVHLIGHSLGGALALVLGDIRAPRIASLTLISPAGLGPEIDAEALAGIVRASRPESLLPWLQRLTATPEAISLDYARAAFRARSEPAIRACQAEMASALFPDGVQAFDLRPALRRLELPAQILWGRQDQVLPMRQVLTARGEFGIHLIDDAGHLPHFERPERVARIALRLMAAVDAMG